MGLIPNLPFSDYLQLPGLSASALKHLLRSPMAYRWAMDHPLEPSAAMALGSAAHTAILEPHRLKTDYILWEGGTRRGKAWEEFRAINANKSILTRDEFEDVKGMHEAVRTFPPAMRYLQCGEAEVSMQWSMGGRAFRGRIDWLTQVDGHPVIVDLKTTRDARPFKFGSDAFRLGYHLQFALYVDGFKAITGKDARFVVIAVESKGPFEPAVFEVPEDVLQRGREEYERLVALLDECEATDSWPPACEAAQPLQFPSYAFEPEDTDISDLGLTA